MTRLQHRRPQRLLARVMVRPPARPSNGAVAVRQMLGSSGKLVRRDYTPRQYRFVINWGNAAPLQAGAGVRVFNKPANVATAVNKLEAFKALAAANVRVPKFMEKYPEPGRMWLARTKLSASCGDGIVVIRPDAAAIPEAPLYVEYVKKTTEFRVHVINGNVVFAQKKKKRAGFEQDQDEKLIRNYDNGWVFCIQPLEELPDDVKQQSVSAVRALGLDFGAVDVIVGRDDDLAYVLEVNTAPGLESQSAITAYKEALTQLVT